jgi:hypothetical protein
MIALTINHEMLPNHVDDIFGQDMHSKRVLSLANATHEAIVKRGSTRMLMTFNNTNYSFLVFPVEGVWPD